MKPAKHTYGDGSITFEREKFRLRIPIGKGKYKTIGRYPCSCPAKIQRAYAARKFEACQCGGYKQATQMRDAALITRGKNVGGLTLRQWGEVWLHNIRAQRNIRTWRNQWNSLVMQAPFAEMPLEMISQVDVSEWLAVLPEQRKKRSVQKDGKRSTIVLDAPVSHQTCMHALGLLRRCLRAAIPLHISENPTGELTIPKPATIQEPLTYHDEEDVERLYSCAQCSHAHGVDPYDLDMLVRCQHLPFEKRTVFCLAVTQCPREGELAGMNWERVDWSGHGWWIAQSWTGPTKNGKTRWQALIPRSEAVLRKWWDLQGQPSHGIMFPAGVGGARAGAKRRFVVEQGEDVPSSEVVARAVAAGIELTVQQVGDYRSKERNSDRREVRRTPRRYAKGYDWGWADHPEENFFRLGWWRRLGFKREGRFHDFRDTAATHLLSGTWGYEWSVKRVSEHLGHSDSKVTEERYASVTKAALRTAAQQTTGRGQGPSTPAPNLPNPKPTHPTKPSKSLALPAGVEPATNGLGNSGSFNDSNTLQGRRQVVGNFSSPTMELAREFLRNAMIGTEVAPRSLATAVLGERVVALAFEVLAGGPHELDRGIQLARLLDEGLDSNAPTAAKKPRRRG